jgi:major membrane immunogen (membrane-anchored lipoprotein)
MKKFKLPLIISPVLIIGFILLVSFLQTTYKDGVYTGKSQSFYTREPYVGEVKITIKDGKITQVDYSITDTAKNEVFDPSYEKHFAGNPLYIQQCRNDLKGMETYKKQLLQNQHIEKVDAVSGATWSYNIFKASVDQALKKAKR